MPYEPGEIWKCLDPYQTLNRAVCGPKYIIDFGELLVVNYMLVIGIKDSFQSISSDDRHVHNWGSVQMDQASIWHVFSIWGVAMLNPHGPWRPTYWWYLGPRLQHNWRGRQNDHNRDLVMVLEWFENLNVEFYFAKRDFSFTRLIIMPRRHPGQSPLPKQSHCILVSEVFEVFWVHFAHLDLTSPSLMIDLRSSYGNHHTLHGYAVAKASCPQLVSNWEAVIAELQACWHFCDKLSVTDGILLKSTYAIVQMRAQVVPSFC